MNEAVPEAYDLTPGNLGAEMALFFSGSACGFAYDLQKPHECEVELTVCVEVGEAFSCDERNSFP